MHMRHERDPLYDVPDFPQTENLTMPRVTIIKAKKLVNYEVTCSCGMTKTLSTWAIAHLFEEIQTKCTKCGGTILIQPS